MSLAEDETPKKRRKVEKGKCIICEKECSVSDLAKVRDLNSWKKLHEAATIRFFDPILRIADANPTTLPDVQYHRDCRAKFTHYKSLKNLQTSPDASNSESPPGQRKSSRKAAEEDGPRVYPEICIFCEQKTKYIKGTQTRDRLIKASELRADKTIREIAVSRCDERILAITSRDLVAAEAHYHATCYRLYTIPARDATSTTDCSGDDYSKAETVALDKMYSYVRANIFPNPRLISLIDLTAKLESFLIEQGVQIKESTKKHLRRNLEAEFGETLHFFTTDRRVYVRPDTLTNDAVASDVIRLEKKIELYNKGEKCDELIEKVAVIIRDTIRNSIKEQSWPPHPRELDDSYVHLPDCLMTFLKVLLGGSESDVSDRINRFSWSFAQDIINVVSNAQVITPKHVLLSYVVKTLTGNVELIRTLNRLGHSCSYTRLEEIDTALCIEKLNRDEGCVPTEIHPHIPTVLAFDNIDRREETLSGGGTSHRINGIVVQPVSHTCAPKRPQPVIYKDKKRSIDAVHETLPVFISGQRAGPPPLKVKCLSTPFVDATAEARQRNLIWLLVRIHDTSQSTSSWTGFNIQTRDNVSVTADTVGYLPTINAPPSDLSTVQEILCKAMSICQSLELEKIAVVMDQALYAKATEVAWKRKLQFERIVLMMGNFHVICNFLSIIGKMYGPAGLRDLAVESGVIAEGSIDKVLLGQQYNRGIRLHKLVYEALMRLVWAAFLEWMDENHSQDIQKLNETFASAARVHDDTCAKTLEAMKMDESCKRVQHLFAMFRDVLHQENGQLASFWMNYIDMVEILLGLVRADREGDWYLHLSCIRNMIPWCFAMDKTNYSRYLPVYYAQMMELDRVSPELHEHFLNGGFSVQLKGKNPFGKIAIDQTLEETVNKDTQTAGGTRGFSTKQGTVSKYYLTAEHRADALRQLREIISVQSSSGHPDLQGTRIRKDQSDVSAVMEMLEDNMTNPFDGGQADLVNISTGIAAPTDMCADMLKAKDKGEEAFTLFTTKLESGAAFYEPIKKLKLKTFADLNKSTTVKGKDKEVILKADHRVFTQMVLIAENRKLDMREVLSYPLGPKPWSLANGDGSLKKTDKATLGKHLEKEIAKVNAPSGRTATVIDGMAMVQKMNGDNFTFAEMSQKILNQVLSNGRGSGRIDIVFDTYNIRSIKNAERINRGSAHGIVFNEIRPGHRIKNWKRLLANGENKTRLISFLSESWKQEQCQDKLGDIQLYVTSGKKCIRIQKGSIEEVSALECTHEEADTRLLLHAKHANTSGYGKVLVISDDTDVLVLFLGFYPEFSNSIFLRRGKQNCIRIIDVSRLGTILGKDVCTALIGLHAWSGCDTVSAFAGQGKVKALNLIRKDGKFREVFMRLGQEWNLDDDLLSDIESFTCNMYSLNTNIGDVNTLRYELFRSKRGDVTTGQLPPCQNALYQHTKRANYQAAIWRRSLQSTPDVPDPIDGHGWTVIGGDLAISWLTIRPAPEVVLSLLVCKCPRVCKEGTCTCMENGMRCTPACRLQNCTNWSEDDEDLATAIDDSDDEEV